MTDPSELHDTVQAAVGEVLIDMDPLVEQLTIAALTRGHVLLEGVPGVAKTTLAHVFARAIGLSYNRIQMTPDILPADITGTSVYREATADFDVQRGPVFANVVVADEINRATPKTQSALLEAMAEGQVSIDGETLSLPEPFVVVATQNPIEMEGTFELPEAQRDRFQQKLTVSLPEREAERALIEQFDATPTLGPESVEQVVDVTDVLSARRRVADVHVAPEVQEYVLDLVRATRGHPDVAHGASPRASLACLETAKARAAIRGRSYVVPDDVKAMAHPVLRHRLVLTTEADLGEVDVGEVVADVRESIAPPGSAAAADEQFAAPADDEATAGAGSTADAGPQDGAGEQGDAVEERRDERPATEETPGDEIDGGETDGDGAPTDEQPPRASDGGRSDGSGHSDSSRSGSGRSGGESR